MKREWLVASDRLIFTSLLTTLLPYYVHKEKVTNYV